MEFEVLHVLGFDSTRKRMSVIVKHPISKEIILYTKGADSAVLSILHKKYNSKFNIQRFYRFKIPYKNHCQFITYFVFFFIVVVLF